MRANINLYKVSGIDIDVVGQRRDRSFGAADVGYDY